MNVLPSDDKVLFLLCDSARPETGGKITLLGYFGGDEFQFPPDQKFPASFSLGMVFMLQEGGGTFDAAIQIEGPHETVLEKTKIPTTVKPQDKNHGIIINLSPMAAPEFGSYTVVLYLDDRAYRRTMNLVPKPAAS